MGETCAVCGCSVHRRGDYARPTIKGRSHATKHHYVAERFFGRSRNRPGTHREAILDTCPWGVADQAAVVCYECHEELLHNPVLLPEDVSRLAELARIRNLSEDVKAKSRSKIAGRIRLLHEVISVGLQQLLAVEGKALERRKSGGFTP